MSSVDDVKQRIDIVDLLSQHITLKRAGRNYVALCPFHSEKTPSFHVDPARQSWHCFGACSTGGDIFSFIMKKDGVEFRDALRMLAEQAGVTLEQRRDSQEDARRARLFEINEAAAAFFHALLGTTDGPNADGAGVARDYLAERAMAAASVDMFQIGYAANSWDGLLAHLEERGIAPPEAVTAGLAVEGERGAYDRFRHRLMFPIRDDRGRVAGFGGRLLPGAALGSGSGDNQPKYVNTAQSAIFDKGAILYALDRAKDAIRAEGRAVIVEGYMDVIAAHEHGFTNVVASMGTALTERQLELLHRNAPRIVLALDTDDAGVQATLRSAQELVSNPRFRTTRPTPNSRGQIRHPDAPITELCVLAIENAKDPDELIRRDSTQWADLVQNAPTLLDFVFDRAATRFDLTTVEGKVAAKNDLVGWLVREPDQVVRAHYLQWLARLTSVDEGTLRLELRQPVTVRKLPRDEIPDEFKREQVSRVRDSREEFCLALLIQYPELRAEASGLDHDVFNQSENRALFEAWVGGADDVESFGQSLSPDLRPQYERILAIDLPAYDDETLVRALHSTVWGIEQQHLREAKRTRASVLSEISAGTQAGIAERAHAVLEGRHPGDDDMGDDEVDPAAAFVEDMEAGLRLHQHKLDQHRPRTAR